MYSTPFTCFFYVSSLDANHEGQFLKAKGIAVDFHSSGNRQMYSDRDSHDTWGDLVSRLVKVEGATVADIGCGGGIYSKALADLGAKQVYAVDFSEAMLEGATENCAGYQQITMSRGHAYDTGLPDERFDIVLARAIIHHLEDRSAFFQESFRILRPGGKLIVQDRTMDDVLRPPTGQHIRGFFFTQFPRLIEIERRRRPDGGRVVAELDDAGFVSIDSHSLQETRKSYDDMSALAEDLTKRSGRSILHELDDAELHNLVTTVALELRNNSPIVDADWWTLWIAQRAER